MKKSIFAIGALALMLTACANITQIGFNISPNTPNVAIIDNKQIVVDQEPLYFAKGASNVEIVWQLPVGSDYKFSHNGIVIKNGGKEFENCRVEQNGRKFACLNVHARPGRYKYTINVESPTKKLSEDPIIIND